MTIRGTRSWLPLAVALATYVGITAALVVLGIRAADGRLVYALDDPYIHLTLARNLAEHGVWGVRPDAFAPVSSSPAWTLLLTALRLAGAKGLWWPLVLNVAAATGLLVMLDSSLQSISRGARLAILLAVVLAAPLPTLALTGMEHSLQILLVVALVFRAVTHLRDPASGGWAVTLVLIALAIAVRYEGLFVAGAFAACLLWQRRAGAASLVAACALLPVLAYGAYAVSQGGSLLPNSLLLKSGFNPSAGWSGLVRLAGAAVSLPQLWWRRDEIVLGAVVAVLLFQRDRRQLETVADWMGALFLLVCAAHFLFVRLQWFFRYEAYVISLGVIAVGLLLHERATTQRAALRRSLPWILLPALVIGLRAWQAITLTPQACGEIYAQQYQLAAFAETHYPQDMIAINDIGAVSYYASSGIFDIAGLATPEVAAARRAGTLDARRLDALMANDDVKAIAMYTGVLKPLVYPGWCHAGGWKIATHVAASERSVEFFARTEAECRRLQEALRRFEQELPAGVTVSLAALPARSG